jgi:hypothetical protein
VIRFLRHATAWVLLWPLAVVWIVFRVVMIPVYWLLVIVPLPVVYLLGIDRTWDHWAEKVTVVADAPLLLVNWIGGEGWNP